MLEGVTPFPAEFAARYRERGYWEDRPLFDGFRDALARYSGRVALADHQGTVTYRQLDERSGHHRKREITQFTEISAARALTVPFSLTAMAAEIPGIELCLVQGTAPPGGPFVSLEDLLEREPRASAAALSRISIDPDDPALFLLSGATVVLGTSARPRDALRAHPAGMG
jgi:2,3-dihydroxybenzoate-AMP ligase